MKIFYSKISFVTVIVTFFAICFFIGGCQQDEIDNTYSDKLPYLDISSNVDLRDLSQEDWNAIKEASKRININIKKGLFKIKQKSGESINMSETLFTLFQESVDRANINIKTGKIKLTKPRTRWDGEFEDEWREADCVAQTINGVFMAMGVHCDESSIYGWIEETYGNNGVPFNYMTEVLNHFFTGHEVPIPADGFISGNSSAQSTIIVLRSGDYGHAANLISVENGIITYMDYQQGVINTGFVTDIMYVYNVYGTN